MQARTSEETNLLLECYAGMKKSTVTMIGVEKVDEGVARALRAKSGAERLAIAHGMFDSARRMLTGHLTSEHPDWGEERIAREVAHRLSHGSG